MKTYAESKGEKPFNWKQVLTQAAADPSSVSEHEHEELKELADHWPTCACGNQDVGIERSRTGAPIDYELNRLGCQFDSWIECRMWGTALQTFEKIEVRAAELLSQNDHS